MFPSEEMLSEMAGLECACDLGGSGAFGAGRQGRTMQHSYNDGIEAQIPKTTSRET